MDISSLTSAWHLEGSSSKSILFLECPPLSHNANTQIFKYMGFKIELYSFSCLELEKVFSIEDKFRLADFDIILICIDPTISLARKALISKEFLDKFREMLRKAEIEKAAVIPVVGMNMNLSGKEQTAQAEIFNGLFIGRDTKGEQIREMFAELIAEKK
jgi:hypothetical protein